MTISIDVNESTRLEMGLDIDQFQEFISDLNAQCRQCLSVLNKFAVDMDSTSMIAAFRPKINPRKQFYSIEYAIKKSADGKNMNCEIISIDIMDITMYIQFCIEEYGEAPPDLIAEHRLN